MVVRDGSLSQAIRTLRRTLGDDSREPIFIRTVSRHGYSFVFTDLVEEPDGPGPAAAAAEPAAPVEPPAVRPAVDDLVARLVRPAAADDEGIDGRRRSSCTRAARRRRWSA